MKGQIVLNPVEFAGILALHFGAISQALRHQINKRLGGSDSGK